MDVGGYALIVGGLVALDKCNGLGDGEVVLGYILYIDIILYMLARVLILHGKYHIRQEQATNAP